MARIMRGTSLSKKKKKSEYQKLWESKGFKSAAAYHMSDEYKKKVSAGRKPAAKKAPVKAVAKKKAVVKKPAAVKKAVVAKKAPVVAKKKAKQVVSPAKPVASKKKKKRNLLGKLKSKLKRKSKPVSKVAKPKGVSPKGRIIRKGAKKVVSTKGGKYPVYAEKSQAAGSFRAAFKKNCAGKGAGDTFSWDGRSYSCERASSKKKSSKSPGGM